MQGKKFNNENNEKDKFFVHALCSLQSQRRTFFLIVECPMKEKNRFLKKSLQGGFFFISKSYQEHAIDIDESHNDTATLQGYFVIRAK